MEGAEVEYCFLRLARGDASQGPGLVVTLARHGARRGGRSDYADDGGAARC